MPPAPHSPEPWQAKGTRVSAVDGSDVCDICPQDDSQVFDANRHLITAAPLLLEALKEAEFLLTQGVNQAGAHLMLSIIQSVIRKAEGR